MDNGSQAPGTSQERDNLRRWDSEYEEEDFSEHSTTREKSPISKWAEAQKRKMETTPPPAADHGTCELEAGLQYMRSALKTAAHEAKLARAKDESPAMKRIAGLLEDITKTLGSLLSKKGKLRLATPPPSPLPKKSKGEPTDKPVMVDACTDTVLTPSWWDSDAAFEAKSWRSRSVRKTRVAGITNEIAKTIDTEVESVDTDAEAPWSSVVKRGAKKRVVATTVPRAPVAAAPIKPPVKTNRPPAILVRLAEGKTYTDTVRSLRACGLSAADIGANVTMRETRDGSLLLELAKGAKSATAAKTICSAISTQLGDSVGKVSQLGVQSEVEILDLDAVSTAAEVLEALRAAIPGQDDPAAQADRESIGDIRIWPTRSGQQIATAKMSRHAASLLTRVAVGWTMCRVRARTLPPERCFRCQNFGHNARICTGPDRTGACWKCGLSDHVLKNCKASDDSCLACELAGHPKTAHRPGSGACAARRSVGLAKTAQ